MNKFTEGQKLSQVSLCDSDCVFTGTVVKRTAKMVTVVSMGQTNRVKIQVDSEGNEYCFPYGRYSMATTFRA